jgi:hypothetical protein
MANKTPTQRYVPGNVPDTPAALIQFLFDELYRIASAINPFPITLNIEQVGLIIPISPVPISQRLFIGVDPLSENPGGAWDPQAGEWICPVSGTYQMSVNTALLAGSLGNKLYESQLAIWVDNQIDPPREVWRTFVNGVDDLPLSNQISLAGPVGAGSVLYVVLTLVDANNSFDATIDSYMSLVQVGEFE